MTTSFAPARADEFDRWLAARRPLGLGLSRTQFAVGDASGRSWSTPVREAALMRRMIAAIESSGRKVWTPDASQVAAWLTHHEITWIAGTSWLFDLSTAQAVARPGVRHWSRPHFLADGEPVPRAASRVAVASARHIEALQLVSSPTTKAAVIDSAELDRTWWARRAMGWNVDVDLLHSSIRSARHALDEANREHGVKFDATTDADKSQLYNWLSEVGVSILDASGEPSLSRDHFDRATIPDSIEARARWTWFREGRSHASTISKCRELNRSLRDGRVFPTLLIRHASTGRGAVVAPALQNMRKALRPLIVAAPGRTLVSLDLGQAEPRVAAAISGDEMLAADLSSGDIYLALARSISATEDVDKETRDRFKVVFLGILYGRGANALAADLGISTAQAKDQIEAVWTRYRTLRGLADELKRRFHSRAASVTSSGRLIPVPPRGPWQALNYRVQSEAADVFYQGVQRVASLLGSSSLFLPIHDELVVEVEHDREAEACAALTQGMGSVFNGIAIGGDAHVLGTAWRKV